MTTSDELFNAAIDHAIELGIEGINFLECWREGDWEGCKEFGFDTTEIETQHIEFASKSTSDEADTITIHAASITVTCPHCEEEQEGFVMDPRGSDEVTCEECQQGFSIPHDAEIRIN